jgi:hypothetical protein
MSYELLTAKNQQKLKVPIVLCHIDINMSDTIATSNSECLYSAHKNYLNWN